MPEPKNIVLCSDGTGNTAAKGRGTNVFKLYEALDHTRPSNATWSQVAFYDDGVGTQQARLLRVVGGAFGFGLAKNVRQLYMNLVRVYNPGDRIYLFGFSRGAFTVRTLAGLIHTCGIVCRERPGMSSERELQQAVKVAYKIYRRRYHAILNRLRDWIAPRALAADIARQFRDQHAHPRELSPICMIGAWDTVDAVGLPFRDMANALNWLFRFKFPDTTLPCSVAHAYHALAIDDERTTFHPVMWNEAEGCTHQVIEQVWFAGVHANIGGGYPKQGMSLVSLSWMMNKARAHGLRFSRSSWDRIRDAKNVHDQLYNSRSGIRALYRYKPRDVEMACKRSGARVRIHETVVDRIRLGTDGYAPTAIRTSSHDNVDGSPATDTQVEIVPEAEAAHGRNLLTDIFRLLLFGSKANTPGFQEGNRRFWNISRKGGDGVVKAMQLLRWFSHYTALTVLFSLVLVVTRMMMIDPDAPRADSWSELYGRSTIPIAVFWAWVICVRLVECFKADDDRTQTSVPREGIIGNVALNAALMLAMLIFVRDYLWEGAGADVQAVGDLLQVTRDVLGSGAGLAVALVGLTSLVLLIGEHLLADGRASNDEAAQVKYLKSWLRFRNGLTGVWRLSSGLIGGSILWTWFARDDALLKIAEAGFGEGGLVGWVVEVGVEVVGWLLGPVYDVSASGVAVEIVSSVGRTLATPQGFGCIVILGVVYGMDGWARVQMELRSAEAWRGPVVR